STPVFFKWRCRPPFGNPSRIRRLIWERPFEPGSTARWRFYDPGSGCRVCLLRCGRCRIEFAVALLDPSRADMALYRHADMVRAIAGTCRVKFLSGFAGGQGENTLAQAEASRARFA